MNRRTFVKNGIIASAGISIFPTLLSSCGKDIFHDNLDTDFDGEVLIIGAGAAGLTAGYILENYGIKYQILEASDRIGGRVKEIQNFADFPIDLGAEWIHTDPNILSEIAQEEINEKIDTIYYNPKMKVWKNDELKDRKLASWWYGEYKFKNSTWFSFFNDFIYPSISSNTKFNEVVRKINYELDKVRVNCTNGNEYLVDKVILTVPLTVLKDEKIKFIPELPGKKKDALSKVEMPDGLKVFINFSEKFYPDLVLDGGVASNLSSSGSGEKAIYDAAFKKDTTHNVLALFTVGDPAKEYINQGSDDNITGFLLNELDTKFDGDATKYFENAIVQNWSKENFINGSYSHYQRYSAQKHLIESLDNKVYFAGETYAPSDIATVHGAARSAYAATREILTN